MAHTIARHGSPRRPARTRAYRRHQRARLQAARAAFWAQHAGSSARTRGIVTDTPCRCSCWMCGNPRRHGEHLTRHEQRAALDAREQMLAVAGAA